MMHRAARTLSINTSNACLVNKFNNSHSGRPYTPLPPSCRLHKIYEEKLEVLGPLGYDNWYDDHANPFYRRPEPELSRHRHHAKAHTQHPFDLTESLPHHGTSMRPASPLPPRRPSTSDASDSDSLLEMTSQAKPRDKITFSTDFTGFESLDSDDSEAEEMIDFFNDGFHDDEDEDADGEGRGLYTTNEADIALMPSPQRKQFEREKRRLSNRNRIMDRGHLMPDTTVYLPILPTVTSTREPRFLTASNAASGPKPGSKVRALSPYPRSRALRTQT